jgi:hypothetical protein
MTTLDGLGSYTLSGYLGASKLTFTIISLLRRYVSELNIS